VGNIPHRRPRNIFCESNSTHKPETFVRPCRQTVRHYESEERLGSFSVRTAARSLVVWKNNFARKLGPKMQRRFIRRRCKDKNVKLITWTLFARLASMRKCQIGISIQGNETRTVRQKRYTALMY
jgi:hypothetical protein